MYSTDRMSCLVLSCLPQNQVRVGPFVVRCTPIYSVRCINLLTERSLSRHTVPFSGHHDRDILFNVYIAVVQLGFCADYVVKFASPFWLSASHDLRLGMDGMLLALCDHRFERSV